MKTAKEPPHKAKIYWQKSQRYVRDAQNATEPDPIVSLAINAVINLVDALCVQYAGERSAGDNHNDALKLLSKLDGLDPQIREAVGRRLSSLLSMKSLAQYEGELLTAKNAKDALTDMERAMKSAASVAKHHGWTTA